jgi:transposase, IS5 family
VFRTIGEQPTPWDAVLPAELAPGWTRCWMIRRSSCRAAGTVLRPDHGMAVDSDGDLPALMLLKLRYRLGCESLCREVGDSISWRRFCGSASTGRCRTRPR